MRKFLGFVVIVFVLLAPPAVAGAQTDTSARDPFVPLIQPSPIATGTDRTVPVDPTVPVTPTAAPDEPLPGTGSPTVTWVGFGYALVALGGGAVVVSKLLGPVRVAAR
jgi:hypothetical protein